MTRTMYDAAYPPPDPHLDVCAFYIGGDTPHVWTDKEIAGQSARWRLPIYTCDNPGSRNAAADAAEAIAWLRAHNVPAGCAVALDYEMAENATYDTEFDRAIVAAGWRMVLYGSLSTVEQNPRPSAGYWTASWTTVRHLDAGAAATQYISDTQLGKPYDLSEVADSLILWDTQGDTMTMAWSDVVTGPNARPGGNEAQFVLTDLGRFRDAFVGDSTALAAYGPNSPLVLLFNMVQAFPALLAQVKELSAPDPAALAAALVANPSALAALAQGIAAHLPAAPTADQIAAAVAVHLGADLSKG